MVILQLGVIFAFLALGELVVWFTGVPVPSSVIGMLLLAASLKAGIVRLSHVDRAADFLVRNLGFFFVPAGVSVMLYFDLIRDQWVPIVGAMVVSTIVVLAVTGQLHQISRRVTRKFSDNAVSRK